MGFVWFEVDFDWFFGGFAGETSKGERGFSWVLFDLVDFFLGVDVEGSSSESELCWRWTEWLYECV